jgi:succinate dehydrogenase/fumarate reductase flavoprotein subunit
MPNKKDIELKTETLSGADTEFDLIVVGAGCAGMSAALFAAIEGLKVLVVERTQWVGGTSALAAGAMWIPNTHLGAGSGDSPAKAAHYLELATGGRTPAALRQRFLGLGPQAVKCLEEHGDMPMRAFPHHPDYMSELPDSTTWGRVLECLPFDGRQLGSALGLVRPPIPEFTVLGGMMVDRIDINHLLNMTRSRASFAHSVRLLLRHAGDRMRYPRGARLVLGNALIGRLLLSLRTRGVPIWTQTRAESLVVHNGRITGLTVSREGQSIALTTRKGVVLAGGGFNDHPAYRGQLIPPEVTHSPRAGSSPGDLLGQVLALGARLSEPKNSAAFWAPVSVRRRSDHSIAVFPHFVLDRAKPGTVVVNASGHRFLNESISYHQFGERMLKPGPDGRSNAVAYLIADRRALVKYGLGMVRPGGRGLAPFLRDGYLVQAPTLEALAQRLGMAPSVLKDTVARMNGFARDGVDSEFQRGTTAYQRNLGDAAVQPNPTLGPIEQSPFYALRLQPGDIAASVGLVTDADARVLRGDEAIEGLYAAGNDMQSVMGDAYPGPGINLGPAVVFAYAAVQASLGNSISTEAVTP